MSSDAQLNCLIIDDEPLAQEVIENHLSQYPFINIVDKCSNAMSAFESLHKHKVDLIFLDINMPVINGLNFLKSLQSPPMVIFTTAYAEYAIEGFELDAVDYLMKPISPDRMNKAIEKALQRMDKHKHLTSFPLTNVDNTRVTTKEKDYIFVKTDGKLVKVNFADLIYCEGMKDYIKLHLSNGKYLLIHQTMKYLEETLPVHRFLRVHKSYIVSLEQIKAIVDNCVMMSDTQIPVPVSATYREELLKIIKIG